MPPLPPLISLVAELGTGVVGHVLFTAARIADSPRAVQATILAPLAVHPDAQGKGIGGDLIREGLRAARECGTELVFVLGYPDYYHRHGFVTAGTRELAAPYPIPEKHADAWMVQELVPGVLGKVSGRVVCADALMDPKYWRE